jgi:hypothetical protein
MRQLVFVVTFVILSVLSGSETAVGDTKAPSTQTFTMECGGATVTIVSPTFSARAAQVVGSTGAAVLQRAVLSDGTVLFEQPGFQAHEPSALTTCTLVLGEDMLTVTVLMTPQRQHNS